MITAPLSIRAGSREQRLPSTDGQPADPGSETPGMFEALLGASMAVDEPGNRSMHDVEVQEPVSGSPGGQGDGAATVQTAQIPWPSAISLLAPIDASVPGATSALSPTAMPEKPVAAQIRSAPMTDAALSVAVPPRMSRIEGAASETPVPPLTLSDIGLGDATPSYRTTVATGEVVATSTMASRTQALAESPQRAARVRTADPGVQLIGEERYPALSLERALAAEGGEAIARAMVEKPPAAVEHSASAKAPPAGSMVEQVAEAARQLARPHGDPAPVDPATASVPVEVPYTTPKSMPTDVVKSIRLALHPIELGHVDVRLTVAADGTMRVHMRFESTRTADIVASRREDLVEALAASGGTIDSLMADVKSRSHVELSFSAGAAPQMTGSGSGSPDAGGNNKQRSPYGASTRPKGTPGAIGKDAEPVSSKSGMFV